MYLQFFVCVYRPPPTTHVPTPLSLSDIQRLDYTNTWMLLLQTPPHCGIRYSFEKANRIFHSRRKGLEMDFTPRVYPCVCVYTQDTSIHNIHWRMVPFCLCQFVLSLFCGMSSAFSIRQEVSSGWCLPVLTHGFPPSHVCHEKCTRC